MDATAEIPGYRVPASMIFSHATRLADSWQPQIERVFKPPFTRQAATLAFTMRHGSSRGLLGLPAPSGLRGFTQVHRRTLEAGQDWIHDARYDVDSNPHHVFCNSLLMVMMAQSAFEQKLGLPVRFRVILRRNASRVAKGVYAMFGMETLETDRSVSGNLLILPKDWRQTWRYSLLPLLAGRIPFAVDGSTPENVYISRRGSRSVANEDEVWGFLRRRGYHRFIFDEKLPAIQQATIVGAAKRIVGIHGAALGWLALNHRSQPLLGRGARVRIVELFGAGYSVDCYRQYAANLGALWTAVRGRITPSIVRDLDFRVKPRSHEAESFHVDLASLEAALDYLR